MLVDKVDFLVGINEESIRHWGDDLGGIWKNLYGQIFRRGG